MGIGFGIGNKNWFKYGSAYQGIDTTNLVSYYKFNNDVTDSKGSNNGTDTPTLTYQTGIINEAGDFNNTQSFNVNIGNDASLQLTTGSIVIAIKSSEVLSGFKGILVKSLAYSVFINNEILGWYSWGVPSGFKSTGVNVLDGNWHQIILTFNDGITNGTKMYIDSVLQLTDTMTFTSQASDVIIGYSGSSDQYYKGLIDEASIWDKILVQSEVTQLWTQLNDGVELL
jgi:hypothetical protein